MPQETGASSPVRHGTMGVWTPAADLPDARGMNTLIALFLIAMMALASGCSFSTSSAASSESSSASSESSSGSSASSSPESKESAYRDDVRDYTQAYVKSGGQFDAFQKRIGELAKKHDITNWEDNMGTYDGVGAGLGRAKVTQAQVDAYKQNLGKGDPKKMEAIQKAYASQL